MKKYTTVLSIAGSDSSTGAGIQADIKTICSLNCYPLTVIAAITAQNTKQVTKIKTVSTEIIKAQFTSLLKDIDIHAVKIGMLFNSQTIKAVCDCLILLSSNTAIVLDPVMVASSGDRLIDEKAIATLKEELFPKATLITPNLAETSVLCSNKNATPQELLNELAHLYKTNFLLKGGHSNNQYCEDSLYLHATKKIYHFNQSRIHTDNTHGSGCSLSSAIACFLAKGEDLVCAVKKAKTHITHAIKAGSHYQLGKGKNGPLYHFYKQSP